MKNSWSKTEEEELINQIKNNISFSDIALNHNRNINSIKNKLHEIVYNHHKNNKTINEINNIVGITKNYINNIIKAKSNTNSTLYNVKIKDLIGKNIIVFDLETTGLPKLCLGGLYFDYKYNTKYDNSRIVSIAWSYITNFNYDNINYNSINEFIIKPNNFIISNEVSLIHGITHENALNNGITLKEILDKHNLGNNIMDADYLIAHNCLFDLNILLNECYRIRYTKYEEKLKYMLDNNKYLCTLKYSKTIPILKKHNLASFYYFYYKCEPSIVHSAIADVDTLLKILYKIYELFYLVNNSNIKKIKKIYNII